MISGVDASSFNRTSSETNYNRRKLIKQAEINEDNVIIGTQNRVALSDLYSD